MRLQFVAEDSLTSWGIRYWTAGPFSHVDSVLEDGRLLGARADAVGGADPGVQIRKPDYTKFSRVTQVELVASPAQEAAFEAFQRAQLDKPYDDTAIWGFAADRNWREDDSWFCSELILAALEFSGWCPKLDIPTNKVPPVALYLIVTARGGIATVIL